MSERDVVGDVLRDIRKSEIMQGLAALGLNLKWDGKWLEASEHRSNLNYIFKDYSDYSFKSRLL